MVSDALASSTALVILMTTLMPLAGAAGQVPKGDCCPPAKTARAGWSDRLIVVERNQAFTIEPAQSLIAKRVQGPSDVLSLGSAMWFDLRLIGGRSAASAPEHVPSITACAKETSDATQR